ncbi:MAG: diaminohydroxyphosphoribosylaminopyrimidine deaminase [Thermacetogenium sp.]|jgi:diaminohydroxyphosphoribosylaminopyrimidine deaminase/5-amino-6-(5-phosphoribosylamino)uracil reductase|uniref:Riboflavin biosynthesis protein RibD n=1 Tax=Thermacetogenium phaeum TaxID=85874 RepID=A0A124FK80_9THEO|nr:MAG: Riboflavin biosynthesis protein RibD [Thermacetogenium phaeum]MDN5376382.1 diaminohydroxyphosphoribosylaminopyrimidine deaminase [Thermacetogenium sp.]
MGEESLKQHIRFMSRALELAALGKGKTSPNPMVGAVVVRDDLIIGEGYHMKAGTPHAEVHALRAAGDLAKGSTLYVTLEPCCHYGKTPPCTEAIIKAGIQKVVVATCDPNPLVAGKGIRSLKEAGIEVQVGIMEEEAQRLNEAFFKYIRTGLPYVVLKVAMSLDGKIATCSGDSKWITGEKARLKVQHLRAESDAVMVGIGTVLADDPLLTVRLPGESKRPLRVIVDSSLHLPVDSQLVQTAGEAPVVVAAVPGKYQKDKKLLLEKRGVEVLDMPGEDGMVSIEELLQELGRRGVMTLLLEGGATLNASALQADIVDKFVFFLSPLIIGGKNAPGAFGGSGFDTLDKALRLESLKIERVGEDFLISGYPAGRRVIDTCSRVL